MLEAWLDFHRQTLLAKCAGLTEDQLRQPAAPPSTLSLMALVRHRDRVCDSASDSAMSSHA